MRKSIPLFLLLCSVRFAEATSFTNGQAAWAVLGQSDFTYALSGAQQNLTGGPTGLAYANGLLFVADSNRVGASPGNNRVLAFPTSAIPNPYSDPSLGAHPNNTCWVCGFSAINVLGQPDYVSTNPGVSNQPTTSSGSMNNPLGVATDGTVLAVADTDNNRILIWNSIPTVPGQPANVVLGAANFTTVGSVSPVTASSLRGPQGLWIQNGKLFVADNQDYRVLIWNHIPTQNNQPADLVLGQSNFTTGTQTACDPTKSNYVTSASELCNPVSVTSDGTHLFVADLGFNRVLIWNSIPTANDQPADVVVGQPDMVSAVPNNAFTGTAASSSTDTTDHETPVLCTTSNGTDPAGNATYPSVCEKTLNFPRYALSDGTRLFIADGGNDRVLIYNSIPQSNGAAADAVLGQPDFVSDIITSQTASIVSTAIDNTSSVDTIPTPLALAWDGTNLYVSDAYNRRVLLFTPSDTSLPDNSVVNWASEIIRQEGVVALGGTITANDTVTITIAGTGYTYTVKSSDTLDSVAKGLVNAINANSGDPNATAIFGGTGTGSVYLSSKGVDLSYDSISLAASTSSAATITATASGGYLSAGTAATGSAGMLVEIDGTNLSDVSSNSPVVASQTGNLPTSLGGAQVFMDGIPAPLMSVSSTQIITQIQYWFGDRNSTSIFVRTTHNDGSITITNATPMYIAPANPGLFNAPSFQGQSRPWPAIEAFHQPGNATAVVSIDGTAHAGDVATITIAGTAYNYTVQTNDTLSSIVSGLVNAINSAPDPNVTASAGGAFTRVVLTAITSGAGGTGITIAGSASSSAQVTVTAYTSFTCCNVTPGSQISTFNPAVPGELITVSAAGLGLFNDPNVQAALTTGSPYTGPVPNDVNNSVSATMNGETAEVIFEGLPTGSYGIYQVQLIVPSDLSTNSATQLYIAQNAFISNIVTVPVGPAVQIGGGGPPGAGISNAQILVNPVNLVFANQAAGSGSSSTQTVTLTNPQAFPLGIDSVQVTGTNASNFVAMSNCGNSLPGGSSCTISVTYTAGATGIQTASLVISDGASVSPQIVPMTGASVAYFEIINNLSGKVLDVTGGSVSNGALIQQWNLLGSSNQKWSLVSLGGNTYAIMNLQSGKVLDVVGGSVADGALIQQYDYLGTANQQWMLTPAGNGYYEIVNVNSGKVLDVTDRSTTDGTLIQQWDYLGGANQQWLLAPSQYYEIVNVNSGKVLDVTNASTADGTIIQQWDYLGGTNQQWTLVPVGNGSFTILNLNSGMVLDVTGGSVSAGTAIQQWNYLGGGNQQWTLMPVGNGAYAIQNVQSGQVLDVTGASLSSGATLQQYPYLGGTNQQWRLVPVQYYEIVNLNSGKVLDVTSQSTSPGALIQQYDYLGGTNQQWVLAPAGGIYYWIISRNSGLFLDVVGGSNAATTLIEQNNYIGLDYQKWALVPVGNGYYSIVNKATGRVLDVVNASTSSTAPIQQYDYIGGTNQQWQLIPIGSPGQ